MASNCPECDRHLSARYVQVLGEDVLCPDCRVGAWADGVGTIGPVAGSFRSAPP